MQLLEGLDPEHCGLWSLVTILAAEKAFEGMSGFSNCWPIKCPVCRIPCMSQGGAGPVKSLLLARSGAQQHVTCSARGLMGREIVPQLSNAVWPAVRDAMAWLLCKLRTKVLWLCICITDTYKCKLQCS
jgi:hypothetical protein